MRLMLLTPGTGHFYCGSCLRDNTLARALMRRGHDVVVVPLYLPRVLEEPIRDEDVHMGGINMYLQQKSRLARVLPGSIKRLLDRPGLLRWAARRGNMTRAEDLGAMTLSMLRGEKGHQAGELEELVGWAQRQEKPDLILLSNVMLVGIVRRLKAALGCPVICTFQGEAPFLDSLPPRFAESAWVELRERMRDIDLGVAVSDSYGELMRERLGLSEDRLRRVWNGLDLAGFVSDPPDLRERTPPTLGYLARLCTDKGLHTLVDAFLLIKERGRIPDLRMKVAGVMLKEDRALVDDLRARIAESGFAADAEFRHDVSREDKLAMLQELSVFSVPATYGESFGLYLLEAMAAGVPVVQPRHGAFPEILEATGGGVLCDPDDATSLADGLEGLLLDPDLASGLGQTGRAAVLERFTDDRMARDFEEVCMILLPGEVA